MSYLYGLNVEQGNENIRISGTTTFANKDKIKAIAGAKWNPAEKCWTVPLGSDLSTLIQPVVQYVYRDPGPNMWAFDRLRDVRRRECCSKCKREFDDFNPQGPMWFVCPVHGKWKSDYTGD